MPSPSESTRWLPEVTESEAAGQTAIIFADIQRCLGVPMVNLIYRHLATVPTGLEWAWCSVRPIVVDGTVADAARRLTESMPDPLLPGHAIWDPALRNPEAVDEITKVLKSYNRANPQNLIIVLSLLELLGSDGHQARSLPAATFVASDRPQSGSVVSELPPMIDLSDIPVSTLELIALFGSSRDDDRQVITPSLYRHLARWPEFLVDQLASLRAPSSVRRIEEADDQVSARARTAAKHIVHRRDSGLAHFALPPEPVRHQLVQQLTAFADGTISRMIVMGAVLASRLPR